MYFLVEILTIENVFISEKKILKKKKNASLVIVKTIEKNYVKNYMIIIIWIS